MEIITYNNVTLFIPNRYFHKNLTDRFTQDRYEKEECHLINKYFSASDNVLEVGSCLGYTGALLSKRVNSVISIEANPELEETLNKCKEYNALDNLRFVNCFISDDSEIVEFQTYDNIVAGSGDREDLEINNVRGWGDSLKVYHLQPKSLMDIEGLEHINAMMLDMEGGELNFLTSYREFIESNVKKVCIELHGHLMKDGSFDRKCIQLFNDMGFNIVERCGISYMFAK